MRLPRIGVVDYGSGNLRSVSKAFEVAGGSCCLVSSPSGVSGLDALVVPGVGSFGDCARNLASTGLWEPIREWIRLGRPYLGICLGYQLLFQSSEESPGVAGLGIFEGTVKRFAGDGLKVPHMGWNTLLGPSGDLFRGIPENTAFYFVHSFYPAPMDDSLVSSRCEYAGKFASSISVGAVHATQFHPEKSQTAGISLLKNFLSTL